MCADAFDTVPGQPRAVERPARGFGKVDHRGAAGLAADIRHADAGDRSAHRHGAGSHCGNQMSSMLAKVTRIVWPMATLSGSAPTTSRSEEHTSELQSLMRTSYAGFRLKHKKK